MGKILAVPTAFLKRHPFPGPGLAVRVLGDVTEGNALEILRQVWDFRTCYMTLALCGHGSTSCSYLLDLVIFSRWMRSSFSRSRMLVFMILYGKLLLCFCRLDQLEFKEIKEHILMLLPLEQLQVKME